MITSVRGDMKIVFHLLSPENGCEKKILSLKTVVKIKKFFIFSPQRAVVKIKSFICTFTLGPLYNCDRGSVNKTFLHPPSTEGGYIKLLIYPSSTEGKYKYFKQ